MALPGDAVNTRAAQEHQMPAEEGQDECRAALRQAIAAAGGLSQFARTHGLQVPTLSVALRQRPVTARIAATIGWEKVVVYRKQQASAG